ncbi:hypothetical protein SUGI_0932270 [Cryptomeria japonica]|nr:hypothetical protein SUGI_0932270 [Cryptomeria japonica]
MVITTLTTLRRQRLKLPPGPAGWPILGNLMQLSSLPHRDMAALCNKYGPLVYLRLGSIDAITTDDPEIIKEILVKQDDAFASRPATVAAAHLAYGSRDVAFAPLGPHWKQMRRICMEHLLTTRRLESFVDHRREEAACMVRYVMDSYAKNGDHVFNLRQVLGAFSMNNVTRMLLGKRYFGGDAAEAADFMDITHELFWLLGILYLGDYVPFWRWIDPQAYEKRMRRLERRMDAFHSRILHQHRAAAAAADTSPDFIHVLLSLPGLDGNPHLDDVEIKALVQDMIAAATDTSSVTNEWAMAEVIKQPRIQRKIQEELDRVVGRERMVEESDLGELQYLRCVVRETFRMHPAGPFLIPHQSVMDTTLGGFHIPANTRVFINTYGLGRNTKIWERVEEFLPERHMTSSRVEISHGTDFKILPFSAGKRKCPGAPLGVCFVLLALARLFHAFHWSAPPGDDIDTTEVYGITMPKVCPLLAIPTPRLPPHLYT